MFIKKRLISELLDRIKGIEHEAELMRTVLIVKEPGTVQAAQTFDGLRKQILAGAAERRSHLVQLAAMDVAVARATAITDLQPQVKEWMAQAGVIEIWELPKGHLPRDLFEDIERKGLEGPIEVIEPAYVDEQTGALIRLGRARRPRPKKYPLHPAVPALGVDDPEGVETTADLPPAQEGTPAPAVVVQAVSEPFAPVVAAPHEPAVAVAAAAAPIDAVAPTTAIDQEEK